MGLTVLVGVGDADRDDLALLTDSVETDASVETRALDGATVVQLLIPATTTSLIVLRSWLLARLERNKTSSVTWKGRKFVGYSASEVVEIITAVQDEIAGRDD
jgi:hypothetical protein